VVEAGLAPYALIQVPEPEVVGLLAQGDAFPNGGACPSGPLTGDPRYFEPTGFRVSDDQFLAYFSDHGGARAFGLPISRRFVFEGVEVQLFELRGIQRGAGGEIGQLDTLGGDRFPYAVAGGLALPPPDQELLAAAPRPEDADYLARAAQLVDAAVPDSAFGLPVGFHGAYVEAVQYEEIYPGCVGDEPPAGCPGRDVVQRIALDLWGLPTGRPAVARMAGDTQAIEAVCQRFERGVLCHDAVAGATAPVPLGAHVKGVLTGQGLPDDLRRLAEGTRFYRQYDPARPLALERPEELTRSDLLGAFQPERRAVP
jgi:hypothetical protein